MLSSSSPPKQILTGTPLVSTRQERSCCGDKGHAPATERGDKSNNSQDLAFVAAPSSRPPPPEGHKGRAHGQPLYSSPWTDNWLAVFSSLSPSRQSFLLLRRFLANIDRSILTFPPTRSYSNPLPSCFPQLFNAANRAFSSFPEHAEKGRKRARKSPPQRCGRVLVWRQT